MKKWILTLCLVVLTGVFSGCTQENKLKDGYYTAELAEPVNGWKEFVTICVSDGRIVTVEYNAKNAAGFIKSWDMAYMRRMNVQRGTYPNRYTRAYAASFLETQGERDVDMVAGASSSGGSFGQLTRALLEKAAAGDTTIAIVEMPKEEKK